LAELAASILQSGQKIKDHLEVGAAANYCEVSLTNYWLWYVISGD
jgi:hypothetical protein